MQVSLLKLRVLKTLSCCSRGRGLPVWAPGDTARGRLILIVLDARESPGLLHIDCSVKFWLTGWKIALIMKMVFGPSENDFLVANFWRVYRGIVYLAKETGSHWREARQHCSICYHTPQNINILTVKMPFLLQLYLNLITCTLRNIIVKANQLLQW